MHNLSITAVIQSLVTARKAKKCTQTEMARQLGLPQSYISRLESGQLDLRLSSLIELARFLNLEVMLIPQNLVPTVEILTGSKETATANSPIYQLSDIVDY